MKKLAIRESMDNILYGIYLKDNNYSDNDIVIFCDNIDAVRTVAKKIKSIIRKATDINYRTDDESAEIIRQCKSVANQYNCNIASNWSNYDADGYYDGEDGITDKLVYDRHGNSIEINIIEISRGNYFI